MGGVTAADTALQFINKNFITLQVDEKKYYSGHYNKVLQEFVNQMTFQDDLFNELYDRLFYAGSVYDGLKISRPDEYDVDLVMKLPVNYSNIEIMCKKVPAGFIKVRATEIDSVTSDQSSGNNVYEPMYSWTDNNGFLLQDQFRSWMFSVVDKTMASLTKENSTFAELTIGDETYQIQRRCNGPASTLNITMPSGAKVDVDLVPVIEFKYPTHWPSHAKPNPFPDKESWFIVPKDNSKDKREFRNTYWRLAFHQQERELIKDRGLLKPVCRLLKKLRDTLGLNKVFSYYIKTIFLSAVDEYEDSYWTTQGLSLIFMDMLKKLSKCFNDRHLGYYWNGRNNLLTGSGMTDSEMADVHIHLKEIIIDITKKGSKDATVFAQYLLTESELDRFKREYLKVDFLIGINDDPSRVLLEIEIKALKKELTKQRNEKQSLENRMEAIILEHEAFQDRLERLQGGIGYLFANLKGNPYFFN